MDGRGSAWKGLVSVGMYPTLLTAALLATRAGTDAGARASVVVMVVATLATVPVLLAQRFLPAEPSWRGRPRDFSVDLLHLLATGAVTELFRLGSLGAVYEAAGALSARAGAVWPSHAPWVLQFALALGIGEFFAYWLHRSCHAVPFLWRFHAVHHSSERMYVLAAARNHPMNVVAMHACHVFPVALLGAPPEVLALSGVFTSVHGLLQHCNVDLRHGFLNWVFSTADLHRWHHSAERADSQTNFGNNLIVWDLVFGTRALPAGRPARVGLGDAPIRENFWAHLLAPFLAHRP